MKKFIVAALAASICLSASAQPQKPAQQEAEYQFTIVKENPVTSIKNQNRSGTCWCFSTLGFLESEVIRIKGIKDSAQYPDFSEMFVVSHSYKDRAEKYIRVDGALGFSAGSECGDVLHVVEDYGIVPQTAMPGLQALPVHGELDASAKAFVEAIAKNPNRTLSTSWKPAFSALRRFLPWDNSGVFRVQWKDLHSGIFQGRAWHRSIRLRFNHVCHQLPILQGSSSRGS
jgi:Peptidase C1-like family.